MSHLPFHRHVYCEINQNTKLHADLRYRVSKAALLREFWESHGVGLRRTLGGPNSVHGGDWAILDQSRYEDFPCPGLYPLLSPHQALREMAQKGSYSGWQHQLVALCPESHLPEV